MYHTLKSITEELQLLMLPLELLQEKQLMMLVLLYIVNVDFLVKARKSVMITPASHSNMKLNQSTSQEVNTSPYSDYSASTD